MHRNTASGYSNQYTENSLDSLLLMQSTILLYKSFPEFDFLSSVYHKLLKLN